MLCKNLWVDFNSISYLVPLKRMFSTRIAKKIVKIKFSDAFRNRTTRMFIVPPPPLFFFFISITQF